MWGIGAEQTGFLDGLLVSIYGDCQDSSHGLYGFENVRGGMALSKRFQF